MKARAPHRHPRAVPKGSASRNSIKLTRNGQSPLQNIEKGAPNPITIGPSSRMRGPKSIIKVSLNTMQQVLVDPC